MARDLSGAEALLHSVDAVIAKYGPDNPNLVRDLAVLRAELQIALKQRNRQEIALLAFRIASWVRYVIELFTHH